MLIELEKILCYRFLTLNELYFDIADSIIVLDYLWWIKLNILAVLQIKVCFGWFIWNLMYPILW